MTRRARRSDPLSRRTLLAALALGVPGRAAAQGLRDLLPAPGLEVGFSTVAATTGWLPLEKAENLILRGRLNGAPVRVVLDSGAGASLVDVHVAQRLGLRAKAARRVTDGAGASSPGADLADVSLTLGSLRLDGLHTVAVDLPAVMEGPGGFGGALMVLGREAFERLIVQIDVSGGRVAFQAPERFASPQGARWVPLLPAADLMRRLPLTVEGAADVPAQFDLGSQSPLAAQESVAREKGWLSARPISTWIAATVAGVRPERTATVRGVVLGGAALPPLPLETVATWDAPGTPLVVGLPLLSRFRMATDYPNNRLWLSPDADALAAPFRKNRSGLACHADPSGLTVLHVAAASPGEAAGFRAGDRIATVDGRPAGQDAGFGDGPPGREVSLALASGEIRRLVLADYF